MKEKIMAYHLACFPGTTKTSPENAFKASRPGPCAGCATPIQPGDPIAWFRRGAGGASITSDKIEADKVKAVAATYVAPIQTDPSLAGILAGIVGAVRSAILPEILAEIEAAIATVAPRDTVTTIQVVDQSHGPAIPVNVGVQHAMFARLLRNCCARDTEGHRLNVWLAGPAGSGKTTAAKKVAAALGLAYSDQGAVTDAIEVFGFVDAGGTYRRTLFREIYEKGGVFLFDEIDGSEPRALVALNAALANGQAAFPDGMVKRHPDCVVIAAANTWGHGATHEYVGRAKQDAASMDRFVRLAWNYDEALEMSFAADKEVCRHVQAIRSAIAEKGLRVLATPRATVKACALVAAGDSIDEALDAAIYAAMPDDAATAIKALVARKLEIAA